MRVCIALRRAHGSTPAKTRQSAGAVMAATPGRSGWPASACRRIRQVPEEGLEARPAAEFGVDLPGMRRGPRHAEATILDHGDTLPKTGRPCGKPSAWHAIVVSYSGPMRVSRNATLAATPKASRFRVQTPGLIDGLRNSPSRSRAVIARVQSAIVLLEAGQQGKNPVCPCDDKPKSPNATLVKHRMRNVMEPSAGTHRTRKSIANTRMRRFL